MENTSKINLISRRDRAYYRRRQQNRVFEAIVKLFAEEAERGAISKKKLAEMLEKDPAQITRWLSAPTNLELDTISDILLAMGAEMDFQPVLFRDRAKPNYIHPVVAACQATPSPNVVAKVGPNNEASSSSGSKVAGVTVRIMAKEEDLVS